MRRGESRNSRIPLRFIRATGFVIAAAVPETALCYSFAPLRRDDREAEGGALLRRYTGLNLYRGFESLSLRQNNSLFL